MSFESGVPTTGMGSHTGPILLSAELNNPIELQSGTPSRQIADHLIRPVDVLVIEDNPVLRRTVATALVGEGYQVLSAADGIDALRVLELTNPWLLFLDIQLPRMDGRDLIIEMRKRDIRTSVVIMTGTQNARAAARELGADGHLSKPFDLDDLLDLAKHFSAAA